jgi:flagella basal body P-ring formation protein FlgA
MVMMNIQIEKLLLIGELARVEDVRILAKIREILCGDAHVRGDVYGGAITKQFSEAKRRIERGEYLSQDDIKKGLGNL